MPQRTEPRIIDLELTNHCNTKCWFCPREGMLRPRGMMSKTTFIRIIDQQKKHCRPYVINFSGLGECLLHPQLMTFITYAKRTLHCAVGITTNGLALTKSVIQKLLSAKPDFITISWSDNVSLTNKLKTLLQHRCNSQTKVHVAFIGKAPSTKTFTQLKNIGVDGIILQPLHNRGGHLQHTMKIPAVKSPCQILNNSLFITWNGLVLSCCHDLAGDNILGDIQTSSLKDILNKRDRYLPLKVPFTTCKKCNDPRRAGYFTHGRFRACNR